MGERRLNYEIDAVRKIMKNVVRSFEVGLNYEPGLTGISLCYLDED